MNNLPETEQWKTDGDCSKCRRVKYCGATCMANKKATRQKMYQAMLKAFEKMQSESEKENPSESET